MSLSQIASRSEKAGHAGPTGVEAGTRSSPLLRGRPNLVDRSFQVAYKVAYRLMRAYWAVRRPSTHGALVILWNRGEVLLVQNSYVPYRSLPGGYVARHETGRDAAVRELAEEIGIMAHAEQLEKVFDQVKDWEGKRDHVEIFALELEHRPEIRIDHREVVDATWFTPERALGLDLFPPIRVILEERLSRTAPTASIESRRRTP